MTAIYAYIDIHVKCATLRPVDIDHVIYAAADLEAATASLTERLGVPAAGGGRHVGIGTHNQVLPLGPGYIEVLAIADPEEAAASGIGTALQARLDEHGDGLWAWAVAVPDVPPIAERLGLDITRIERQGLTAHLAGVARAMRRPSYPFFIERDPGVADPSAGGTAGGLTWVEVSGPTIAEGLPVRTGDGPPGVVAVGIGEGELR
jgi:hypothetical protein